MTLRKLAEHAKAGVRDAGGVALEFGTITVSDGISMGHEGMRASLVSREVISDSVETVMHAERFDGFVGLAGCDKSIPGMLMAAARLDLASVFVYNGSIMPGEHNGVALDITSVFEAVGACAAGTITEDELLEIERKACPGEGACGGMFTANTMSSIAEAIGMSLPGTASPPAIDDRREGDARRAGEAVVNMLRLGITPRQIMTKQAFENAIARHVGARRLDERGAAPVGDRQRGARGARSRRLQPDRRPGAAHRRHEARRQVPHERPRPRRRRPDGVEAPPRHRPCSTAT